MIEITGSLHLTNSKFRFLILRREQEVWVLIVDLNVGAKRGFLPYKEHITLGLYGGKIEWSLNLSTSIILGFIHLEVKMRTVAKPEDAIHSSQLCLNALEALRTLELR